MKKDRYIYPAVFSYEDDGISIEFPDLPGCLTCGDTTEEALKNAKEAMELYMYGLEEDGEDIPSPTEIKNIKIGANETIVLIDVWMVPVRDYMENRAIKKTLTIPKWLNEMAEENGVNFSHILQNALKEYLGLNHK